MIECRTAYGFGARIEVSYDEAVERVKRALQTEGFGVLVGLLLPCNVVVYEADGGSVVEALDPEVSLGLVRNDAVAPLAAEAKERLTRVLAEATRG